MKELKLNLVDEQPTSGMHLEDSFHARGDVKISLFKNGEFVETIENHNLIVKTGRSELIKRIANTSTLVSISKMSVGNGGAPSSTPFTPNTPTDSDTALAGASKYQKSIDTITPNLAVTNPQVTFSATFDSATVNSLVNEAGLFWNDGTTMFARYCFKTVSLESGSGFSMKIDWTIQF
jgi:hypothetical protein